MGAWNGWYHVTSSTYGTWLPGDPRGWRSKGHKKHVDGDYRNPPPAGADPGLLEYCRGNLKDPPVRLTPPQRRAAGEAIVQRLLELGTEPIVMSVDGIHLHVLLRPPDTKVRQWVGRAKKHAHFVLHRRWGMPKVWQRGTGVRPIQDRRHQLNVFEYIRAHERAGAWVWTFREGVHRTTEQED